MSISAQSPKPFAFDRHTLASYGSLTALILLVLLNIAITPNFLAWQTLNVNLTQVAPIVIVGIGMTLVIATRGIDLSVGSLMAISGALAPIIFLGSWFSLPSQTLANILAVVVPICVTCLFGAVNGWLITRFNIQPIIATLILFIAGRGIAQVATNGNLQNFQNPNFQFIGLGRLLGLPTQVWLMLAVVLCAAFAVRRTLFGRQLLAVGGNQKAARLSGVPAAQVKRMAYVISGACAGLAGLIVISINSSSDANQVGLGMELDAIAATAVGGTLFSGGRAKIFGTLVGALIIQLTRYTLLANGIPDAAALVVKAGLIIAAVWLQGARRA